MDEHRLQLSTWRRVCGWWPWGTEPWYRLSPDMCAYGMSYETEPLTLLLKHVRPGVCECWCVATHVGCAHAWPTLVQRAAVSPYTIGAADVSSEQVLGMRIAYHREDHHARVFPELCAWLSEKLARPVVLDYT